MRYFLLFSFYLFVFILTGQVSVYDNCLDPIVTQTQIDNGPYEFSKQCVLFDNTNNYQFTNSSQKKIVANSFIHIQENFFSGQYDSTGNLWLKIDTNCIRSVYAMNYSDLSTIEALKKFELAIDLPDSIEQRIQDFINTSDTINGGINPYLEWQLCAEAIIH